MRTGIKHYVGIGSFATVLSLAPLAFSPGRGIEEQQACAQSGTCCPEPGSICVIGTNFARDYYFKPSGRCAVIE
jgi:hypothetical protein